MAKEYWKSVVIMIDAKDLMEYVSHNNTLYDPIVELRDSIMFKLIIAAKSGFHSEMVIIKWQKHLPVNWFEQIDNIFTNKGYTVKKTSDLTTIIFSWPKANCP